MFLWTLKLSCLRTWAHLQLLNPKKSPPPLQFNKIGEEFKGLVSAGFVLYTLISAAGTLKTLARSLPPRVRAPTHRSDVGHPCLTLECQDSLNASALRTRSWYMLTLLYEISLIIFFFTVSLQLLLLRWGTTTVFKIGFVCIPLYIHVSGSCETCLPPSGCSWSLYALYSIHLLPLCPAWPCR